MTRDKSLVFDIYTACEFILIYVKDVNYEQFANDTMRQDAVIRRIEIIGEASNKLTDEFKEQHPEIPWSLIRGTRNRLVHDYGEVDIELVWTTCQNDIRSLKVQLAKFT